MKRRHKVWIICAGILILVYLIINLFRSYYGIQITHYEVSTNKFSDTVNMVIVADLHNREYGSDNEELVEMILSQEPDAVLMVGDMLNDSSKNWDVVVTLVEQLAAEVPVYYAMGNHELKWERDNVQSLMFPLEEAGATVLNQDFCDIDINGQEIRIGGLYSYSLSLSNLNMDNVGSTNVQIYNFLSEYQDTDAFKLLLSHRPAAFAMGDASKMWDIDLVVSGHLHGGQIVLSFWGGVSGGEQGLFPTYVHGLYEKDKVNLLITSGLGSKIPGVLRWNNPPEIVVLEIQ